MQVTLYRPLDAERDWALFDQSFEVDSEISATIRPLAEQAAREFWEREVAADPLKRHPMLLSEGHWLAAGEQGPSWLSEFESSVPGEVEAFVLHHAGADEARLVYFVNSREDVYELPLGSFLSSWRALLAMNDEGPFLYNPASGHYVCFGPNGSISAGRRP